MMRFDIVSANPKILDSSLTNGLISRVSSKGLIEIHMHNLREYAEGNYKQIDDTPYGGGAGMILKPEPIFKCVEGLMSEREYDEVIYFSAQGIKLKQKIVNDFSLKSNFILICGHYKGIDERVIKKLVTQEVSIGDYVLSCGDVAALVFIDSVARLLPGALGDGESALTDSFQVEAGFDCPQYTRPEKYKGMKVPDVLLSGNHNNINIWRNKKATAKFKKIRKLNKS
ncbi:MAG: tRNA (guanosine(37)-N1)-methyltransferase TrmD [Ignavibacteriae bacterium]|nr:tRNA (guanosine(37)-N1)-methyltransferase TrmD [Ignavibacteriota bacterium]